ncbi:MAG: non-heme iron oxygenase ferredoxin subunit [Anaerolineae bacterium]|nr:non-heme iron oxygenase ferredoxin subunit [Anaerolineae bacterium]
MVDFVSVAKTDEIQPGERLIFELGKRWIAVFNVDGQYYAIEDVCSHDDGPLAEGKLIGCQIECPRHGAKFDLRTGEVLTPPALVDVPVYQVRVIGDEIQVSTERS